MFDSIQQMESLTALLELARSFPNKPRDDSDSWEPNILGIFGPRGSGKSTILRLASKQLATSSESSGISKLHPLPPLDCTQIPQGVNPGCAVLLHLLRQFEGLKFNSELLKLAERYSLASREFGNLCLDLSGSLEEFEYYHTEGTKQRLTVKNDLTKLLNNINSEIGCGTLIIPLDDFDLTSSQMVIDWINALLDVLNQKNILFLVTADLDRLQHILSQENGFDEKTSRSIINKLIPPAYRVTLDEWSFNSPSIFPEEEQSIIFQLESILDFTQISMNILFQILPRRPRGLKSLNEKLAPYSKRQNPACTSSTPFQLGLNTFLELLAICREETLLARRLKDTSFAAWPAILGLGKSGKQNATWGDLLDQAIKRAQGDLCFLEPLPGFEPADHEIHVNPNSSKGQRTEMSHAPDWGYPLRQDHLKSYSLRDAQPESAHFWTELLYGLSFKVDDRGKAARNRVAFVQSWQPIKKRLNKTRFEISAETDRFQSFFNSKSLVGHKAAMLWIKPKNKTTIILGWNCLLRSLAGVEDPLHHSWRHQLFVSSHTLQGELPELGHPDSLALLPDEIWALILLTEGLSRCPWLTFSRESGWQLQGHLALCAALVRSAFVFALVQAKLLEIDSLSEHQNMLHQVLKLRDPMTLVSDSEGTLMQTMNQLFHDGLDAKILAKQDSLSRAFNAFLNSAPYTAVVAMTEDVIKLQKIKARKASRTRST